MARTRAAPRRNVRRIPGQATAAAVQDIENIRRKNKDIKLLLPQTKNIVVKHSGRLVRRMTVRKPAIFPTLRRQKSIFTHSVFTNFSLSNTF